MASSAQQENIGGQTTRFAQQDAVPIQARLAQNSSRERPLRQRLKNAPPQESKPFLESAYQTSPSVDSVQSVSPIRDRDSDYENRGRLTAIVQRFDDRTHTSRHNRKSTGRDKSQLANKGFYSDKRTRIVGATGVPIGRELTLQISDGQLVSVQLGELISLFEDRLDRPLFVWLKSSANADKFVTPDTLVRAGIRLSYDERTGQALLSIVP